jgi:hypothetical protein
MARPRKKAQPDQLAQFRREVAAGTWLTGARTRAQRRKSFWNLLLPLLGFPLWGLFAFALAWAAYELRLLVLGGPGTLRMFMAGPMRLASFLVLLPSLFAAIAPAFLVTNFLVYLVPPARLAMEVEDRNFPSAGYRPSQSALARMAGWYILGWAVTTLLASALP